MSNSRMMMKTAVSAKKTIKDEVSSMIESKRAVNMLGILDQQSFLKKVRSLLTVFIYWFLIDFPAVLKL